MLKPSICRNMGSTSSIRYRDGPICSYTMLKFMCLFMYSSNGGAKLNTKREEKTNIEWTNVATVVYLSKDWSCFGCVVLSQCTIFHEESTNGRKKKSTMNNRTGITKKYSLQQSGIGLLLARMAGIHVYMVLCCSEAVSRAFEFHHACECVWCASVWMDCAIRCR